MEYVCFWDVLAVHFSRGIEIMKIRIVCLTSLVVLLSLVATPIVVAQFGPAVEPPPLLPRPSSAFLRQPEPAAPTPPDAAADEATDTARPAAASVDPRMLRLHLMDGSIITGELSVDDIKVQTDFGLLTVPVERIRSFSPGLDSYPQIAAQIAGLIEILGSDDYPAREQAHKDLSRMGVKILRLLEPYRNDANAERKRHVLEVVKELEELMEEESGFDEPAEKPWIHGDTMVTSQFTIVGKIVQDTFQVSSKYGPLTVKLADVRTADRAGGAKQPIQKRLTVEGTHLAQKSFKSSGIRVERGDKIEVRADGQIIMTPWGDGYVSSPDGGEMYGWYANQILAGALVAKIGNSGQVIKIGSRSTFVAKTSGLLQFAIGMAPDFANEGYSFPGQYNLRIKVEPN
jgi:hypothetical protein